MVEAALQCAREIAGKPPVAIWSNAHVREAVTAMKEKRAGTFPALDALQSFREL